MIGYGSMILLSKSWKVGIFGGSDFFLGFPRYFDRSIFFL
jgi:hypothetical protein